MDRRPVDIIVPIYNAYEDLKKCVSSLKKYTDLSFDRVILINDCSTDERMRPYLISLQEDNVLFIDNDENAGFSNNVNKGMNCSEDRDVILLNSDTIVTKNWVNKIYKCAYSKEEIGTVTPLSNSATLCSYPVMCQDNDIPENLTLDQLAEIVERCSMQKYPRITVAVGFCMFIKRRVINEVGLFDASTFERGYGEENDFCNRAEQLGYIHVMCDDTLIYHRGTVSFVSEEKQKLIDSHDKILVERYPEQMRKNHLYCVTNPDKYIRDNIDIYAKVDPDRKNIMYVIHSDFREDASDNMGGTQFHVRDLVKTLKYDYNVYVAARDGDYLRVTLYRDEEKVSLKYYIGPKDLFPRIKDSDLFTLFENLLKAFKINMLHVHHTYGLSFDMVFAAEMLGIPVVLTMHDYYYVCPNVKLFDCQKQYCGGNIDNGHCDECINKCVGVYVGRDFMVKWRNACENLLGKCADIVVPSEAAKKVVINVYPGIEKNIHVIEHGTELLSEIIEINDEIIEVSDKVKVVVDNAFDDSNDLYKVSGWGYIENINANDIYPYVQVDVNGKSAFFACPKILRPDVSDYLCDEKYMNCGFSVSAYDESMEKQQLKIRVLLKYDDRFYTNDNWIERRIKSGTEDKRFNVAFIGGMVEEKGSVLAKQMIAAGKKGIRWHIFGTIGDGELIDFNQENLVKHGTYRQCDLPKLFKQYDIDAVCILSVWPETFCYTLSEAIICNTPVFVTDMGAVGERVKRNDYGWVVPNGTNAKEMVEVLYSCLKNKDEYMEKKKAAIMHQEKSLYDMSREYVSLYQNIINESKEYNDYDRELIFKGLYNDTATTQIIYNEVNSERISQLENELNTTKAQLECIRSKFLFRLYRKVKSFIKR